MNFIFVIHAFRMRSFLLTLAGVVVPLTAPAHDLWFERDGSAGYLLMQGHRHSTHAGSDSQPYDPAWVREALCLSANGKAQVPVIGKTHPVRLSGDCAAIQAHLVSGYWTKNAWETKNVPKTGVSGVLKSWFSDESVKRIDRWLPTLTRPLADGLEICPTINPLTLKAGDKLVVQVNYQGKPKAGVAVAYFGDTRGATDEEGKIAIRLRQPGIQLIAASFESPLSDGKADTAIRSAALQFEIAP